MKSEQRTEDFKFKEGKRSIKKKKKNAFPNSKGEQSYKNYNPF